MKSGNSELAEEIVRKLSDKTELYQYFRQEALYNHERLCNGKRMKDCPKAYKYALAAYFVSHLENVSTIGRYDLTSFGSKIGPKTTHVIFILPYQSYMADQLTLSFNRKVNVSIVSLEPQQHSIDLIGGDYRNYVDRLYLESIHADIYTRGDLQVDKLILYNSSYSRLSNTYTVAKSVPLYLHVNSIPRLKSTSVDDTYIFSDECDIESIGSTIKCGNEEYSIPQSDKSKTYYTSASKIEVNSGLTLSFQNIQFMKMNDIFPLILNFENWMFDPNRIPKPTLQETEQETLTIKSTNDYNIDVTIPPGKALQIVDTNDNPIDISDTSVSLGQFSRVLLNVDDLDMDTLSMYSNTSEESKPEKPKFAIFIRDIYISFEDQNVVDNVMNNLNHTDLLFDYFHNKSVQFHEEYCKGKNIKDCPDAIHFREAEYVLSNTIQIMLSNDYDDIKKISQDATHLLILSVDFSHSILETIDFSLLPHKMNVSISSIMYGNAQLRIAGGDYLDKVDRLYLYHFEVYIYGEDLNVGSVIFNQCYHNHPKDSPYSISDGVPVLYDMTTLFNYNSKTIDNIYFDKEDCETIELRKNSVGLGSNFNSKIIPKRSMTVYTLTDHLLLNITSLEGHYLNKIIISPHKVQYLDIGSVAHSLYTYDLIFPKQNQQIISIKKRPKIVSDTFTLNLTGSALKDLPSTFSIEIQLPRSAKLTVIDNSGFPVPLTRYGIKKTEIGDNPYNIDDLDYENIEPIYLPEEIPSRASTSSPAPKADFLNGISESFYYFILYGSLVVILVGGFLGISFIRIKYWD